MLRDPDLAFLPDTSIPVGHECFDHRGEGELARDAALYDAILYRLVARRLLRQEWTSAL